MAGKIRSAVEPSVKVSLFEIYDNKQPQFARVLQKGKEVSRVFLILCYINEVLAIMKEAQSLGMTNGKYAFITLDLNTDVFYKDGQWTGNQGSGSEFPDALTGIIDLSVYRPDLSEEFRMTYKNKEDALEPAIKTKLYHKVSWYSSFLYDALFLYSLAVNDTLTSGYDIDNTSEVISRMVNQRFQGKSGHVVMENGTRVPQFVVGNLRDGSYKFIGNSTNLPQNTSGSIYHELHLLSKSDIKWPGGANEVPLSEPRCGFSGERCPKNNKDDLSIILGVFGACTLFGMIFAFVICARRRVKEQENFYTRWIINFKEITPSDDGEDNCIMLSNYLQVNRGSVVSVVPSSLSARLPISGGFFQQKKFRGIYLGKTVLVKKVCGGTSHLTDNMKTEIRQACDIRHVNLNPYVGMCVEFPDVYIVSEYCAKGSLQDILLNDAFKLDWNFRMSFALDIARGMEELHKSSVSCHGNLKSTNVLVDSHWICRVADYGLKSFKENKLLTEESLQTQSDLFWTAPEHLRITAGKGMSQLGDVYSYGIILQEIALREKPFSTSLLGPKEILYFVRKGIVPHCRPQVPPDIAPGPYIDLMKMCWYESPERRPTFSGILKLLKKINHGKAISLIDNMLCMMEKYTNNLESLVNERTRQLQNEKSKTDELLHKMLPRSIAESLKTGIEVKAEQYDNVTIFYSDISEFSTITAVSSPIQVINLVNDFHSLYDTVMTRYDVYKVETSSDSYLVVSGLPERNGNKHAEQIASMSLHLVAYLRGYKISHIQGMTLQFRIGIHSGPCVAGVVGLKKPRYDIFGETVNIAKQLEETGTAQNIHVSSSCKLILDDLGGFHLKERGLMNVKGLGETTTFYLMGKVTSNKPSLQ